MKPVVQIERAVDTLRSLEDPSGFLLANQCYYAALTYLSRWEDLSRIGAEGADYALAIGDDLAGANSLVWGAFGDRQRETGEGRFGSRCGR